MSEHYSLLIAGEQAAAGTLTVNSPFNGELIATAEQSGDGHIEAALATAHALYRDRKNWLTLEQRVQILERTAELMSEQVDSLATTAASEGGKPWLDTQVEVNRAIAGVKMCAEHIQAHAGEVIPLKESLANTLRIGFTQKEPIGVVVAVSAFNHPLNLIVHQVGAAIAAGCPVIVKPAEDTPLSCLRFAQLLLDAGLPKYWVQVALPTTRELSTALVSDSRVGFFSFIGSARVGWMLRSKLAAGTRCALEHGGVAPVIVDETADLAKALPAIAKGGFYHAGQVCVSVQRVFVHKSLSRALAEGLTKAAQALRVGDPLDAATEVGPLIRLDEVNRVHDWITEAVDAGAEKLCGGEVLDNNCYAPTVLLNPPVDAKVSCQEIFGPLVCIYEYNDLTQAIEQANSLDVSFQAAVFTQDIDKAMSIYHRLDASAVMVNDHTAFRQDNMPFAGLRQSGLGVGGIGHTIDDMRVDKMMVVKSTVGY